jgi:two-component system, NtrC family, response regulator AtoC
MASKVLVVDDDPATCSVLVALLEASGYRARGSLTFQDGRIQLHDDPPDVLIVDIRLGPFNGLQLIVDSPAGLPCIVVSGYADPTLRAEAHRLGADYLEKPVTPTMLIAAIQRKIEQNREAGIRDAS